MPGIYDFGIRPLNLSQDFEAGQEKARQKGLRGLMGDYYGAQDPRLGEVARMGGDAGGMQRDMQGQEDRKREQLGQFATLLAKAPEGMRPGIYKQMYPQLSQLVPDAPPDYTPEIDGMAMQIAQMYGGAKGADPESFSNGGQGFLIGSRGTVRPIEGYADQAGQIAHAQAQARGQAQQQYRAPQRVAATGGGGSGGVSRRAPSGYEWTPDGSLRAIRGGPADKPHAAAPGKGPNGAPLPKSSGDERAAMGYLGRMSAAEGEIQKLYRDGYDPGNLRDFFTAGEGVLLNPLASDKGQLHRQQQEDFVRAKLRKESGAAIPVEEMDREIKTYFPQPGDSDMVVQGKTRSRQQALKQMETMAGRAYVSPNRPTAADADAKIGPLSGGLSADEQAELDELRKRFGKK